MARELVEGVVARIKMEMGTDDREAVLMSMADQIDNRTGLYDFAKMYGVLVNNSAEEFAMQFYGTFNDEVYPRY